VDGLTAILVAVIVGYGLRAKESRERIQLLGSHLQAFEIERLLEQLHVGYQRALNETQPGTRELIWQQLENAERQLSRQAQELAKAFDQVPAEQARVSKWAGVLPYVARWLPQGCFDMREMLHVHAQGLAETAANADGLSQKQKAFRMLAEMLLFQHSCHWFCKSRSVATARMVLRHHTAPEQAVDAVSPRTRMDYLHLLGETGA
jgi:hypothetical protein